MYADLYDVATINLLMNVEHEMSQASSRDSINKLYRQARIWVRMQCHYANMFDADDSRIINNELKHIRWRQLDRLSDKKGANK